MTRRGTFVVAVIAATGSVALAAPVTASAAGSSGSATAKAVYGSAATIAPGTPTGTGALGAAISALLQPIVDVLTQQVDTLVSTAVIGLLNSAGDTADTTTGPASYPTGPLANVSVPGVLGLTLNGPSGSVSATASAYSATSTFASPSLTILGQSIANLGVASASVTCPVTGSGDPSASVTLSGVSLFNGAVKAKLANGSNLMQVSLNGGPYQSVSGVGTTLTVVPGTSVSVRANGNFLQVSASITLATLLNGLGLGGLLSQLNGVIDTSGTALTLSLTIGPGNTPPTHGSTSATAWGLEVGADLAGTISVSELSMLGLLAGSSTITIPSGISGTSYGNLLDLKLGYATCTSGNSPSTGSTFIPPGLI